MGNAKCMRHLQKCTAQIRGGGRTSISVRPCSRTQSGINRIRSVHTEVANQHRSDIFDLV